MRLKSPTDQPISFGTANGSGHSMVLGPEGDDVPAWFIQSAFAAGAVPDDVVAESFVASPVEPKSKTDQESIQAAMKAMLERNEPDDFTLAGTPNRKALAKLLGCQVTAEETTAAWLALNESV